MSEIQAQIHPLFEGLITENLLRNPPVEVGAGGEQVVFMHEASGNDVVVKIGYYALSQPYNKSSMNRLVPDEGVESAEQIVAQNMARNAALRYEALLSVFGPEHVPMESIRAAQIPLNGRTIRKLGISDALGDGDVRWFWTTVRRQNIVPALRQPDEYNVHDFGVGYAEKQRSGTFTEEEYVQANRRWIEGDAVDKDWTDEDWHLFMAIHGNESIRALVKLLDDPNFRPVMADFLGRACQLAELAGETLDASKNNVIFYQNPGEDSWRYTLVDALLPYNAPASAPVDSARSILRGLSFPYRPKDIYLSPKEGRVLLNTLGFARVVNALSEYMHLPGRIRLPPGGAMLANDAWATVGNTLRL